MNTMMIKKIPTNLNITVSTEPMSVPDALQESIESYWESLKSGGKTFHRGEVYSIKEMNETENELQVILQKTDYAHFLYSKNANLTDSYRCRVIVANGLLVTRDKVFLLGEMNKQTATPGRIQFVAGGIDEQDVHSNRVEMTNTLMREVKEEVGIDVSDPALVNKVEPRYIVHWGNIALIYLIHLQIDSAEFMRHYEQFEQSLLEKGIEPEFSSIIGLPANQESVYEFLTIDERPRSDFLTVVLEEEVKL